MERRRIKKKVVEKDRKEGEKKKRSRERGGGGGSKTEGRGGEGKVGEGEAVIPRWRVKKIGVCVSSGLSAVRFYRRNTGPIHSKPRFSTWHKLFEME